MKRKKLVRIISAGVCVLLLGNAATTPAHANSAQTRWDGVDATGAVISKEDASDSPIIVEKEVLTFDIPEFPQEYYSKQEGYLNYGAKVTAEYTFYNPADYTVTATLLFPFGNEPDYAYHFNDETGERTANLDTEKFDILINGEAIEKKIRYSLTYPSRQFELETDLALLHDGFAEDDFYTPELTVTKYTYTVSGVDTEKYRAACMGYDITKGRKNDTKVYFPAQSGYHTQEDGDVRISAWVNENREETVIYAIGEPFATAPKWKFYGDGGVSDKGEIEGTATLESVETMTLYELVMADWSEETGVSEIDWYNAVVAEMKVDETHNSNGILSLDRYKQGLEGYLMRWYEYEITLAPEERIMNTVTAPIYPGINLTYEPPVYYYTYLLSPAKTWTAFLELEIYINTPYYVTESTVDGLRQYSDGYLLFLDGLPAQELEFTLSAVPNPEEPGGSAFSGKTFRSLILLCAGAICIAGTFGNLLSKGRKKGES